MNARDEGLERQAQVEEFDDQLAGSASGSGPAETSDDDFLDSIASLLPDEDREVKEALERVKDVYVPCGRDKVLADTFGRFVVHMLAKRNGKRDDGRAFFITGESGAGKTWAVEHMLASHPALAPQTRSFGTINPVISVNLSGPSTLKTLGKMILRKAGYPIRQKMEQGELWDMLPQQLHIRKVLIVHIDETQHMLRHTETDQERKNLAKAFKGVMNYKEWPVSFIMSGMPETTEMSRLDEQIERRARFGFLPDIQFPEERGLVVRIVSRMCEAGNLDPSRAVSSDLPERIAHAARYRYGRIAQVVLAAIQMAFQHGDTVLARDHFALAFLDHSHARGFDEMNPFLVDDWHRLDPGSFLIKTRED